MNKSHSLFLLFFTTMILLSCVNKTDNIKAGSICTVENGEGKFGIVKVLVINDQEAHIKIYKNKFDQRPTQVDLKTLSLGSLDDKDGGFGIGHIPLERNEFNNWKPIPIGFEDVKKDELFGYEMWKNQ